MFAGGREGGREEGLGHFKKASIASRTLSETENLEGCAWPLLCHSLPQILLSRGKLRSVLVTRPSSP